MQTKLYEHTTKCHPEPFAPLEGELREGSLSIGGKFAKEGFTFDDVLLVPARSDVLPSEVDTSTALTGRVTLHIPIISAAMDTVTEAKLAIAIAREGGLGIIHRNMSIAEQSQEVVKVKRWESGMIQDPITLPPDENVSTAVEIMNKYHISGLPVTEGAKLVGILTNRDLRFEENFNQPIKNLMTKENLITAPAGTSLEEARKILHKHKIEKLPVVDKDNNLRGLITVKDIQKKKQYPNASKDSLGRLLAGAAVGVDGDAFDRAAELVKAGVDIIVVDTAHGHSRKVLDFVKKLKTDFDIDVIAGNVVTYEGAEDLFKVGADVVKVGTGPGSICTTRVVAGVGMPQLTAVYDCGLAAAKYNRQIIADGGITNAGDITKALAAGSSCVMIGGLFAGTDESPGDVVLYGGERFKEYRGMGSLGAMKYYYGRDRYGQGSNTPVGKLVPEGIEARVPYTGPIANIIYQLIGGLRSGMGYLGAGTAAELRGAKFVRITSSGVRESHPHDVQITKDSPSYFRKG